MPSALDANPPELQNIPATANTRTLWLGLALCCASGVGYGFQGILAKFAYAQGANVTTVLTLRFGVATLGVWLLAAIMRPQLKFPLAKLAGLWTLGAFFITSALFFFLALDQMGAGTSSIIVYIFPGLVVLWAAIFFKERLSRLSVVALGLALVGCVLTVDPLATFANNGTGTVTTLGVLFALGSALSNSIYITLSQAFSRGVSGLAAAFWSVPVTALGFLGYSLLSGTFQFNLNPLGWLYCSLIGLLACFSIITYLRGVQLIGASRGAITATSEPVTSIALGILLLSEPASLIKLLGATLVIAAVVILSRAKPMAKTSALAKTS